MSCLRINILFCIILKIYFEQTKFWSWKIDNAKFWNSLISDIYLNYNQVQFDNRTRNKTFFFFFPFETIMYISSPIHLFNTDISVSDVIAHGFGFVFTDVPQLILKKPFLVPNEGFLQFCVKNLKTVLSKVNNIQAKLKILSLIYPLTDDLLNSFFESEFRIVSLNNGFSSPVEKLCSELLAQYNSQNLVFLLNSALSVFFILDALIKAQCFLIWLK